MNLKNLLFASVIVLSANASFAQDTNEASHNVSINIPAVALLDLETTETLNFSLVGAVLENEAGLPISFETAKNTNTWINYSSILGAAAERKVTVAMTGTIPAGLKLTVSAAAAAIGKGDGTLGTSTTITTPFDLSSASSYDIITGVGSAYTGNGNASGHQLTYQLGLDAANYADLNSTNTASVEITYTLVDM